MVNNGYHGWGGGSSVSQSERAICMVRRPLLWVMSLGGGALCSLAASMPVAGAHRCAPFEFPLISLPTKKKLQKSMSGWPREVLEWPYTAGGGG